jgi:GNAT superfamily N-acetyltransferase
LRPARREDAERLLDLLTRSVHGLQALDYSPSQRAAAIGSVFGVDLALIDDGTYFVVEQDGKIIGSGGWSRRATLFGVHQAVRDDRALRPGIDPARIRAFFIDPAHARSGLGGLILTACEQAALVAGFTDAALAATLTGAPFYRRHGYVDGDSFETPLPNGESMALIAMCKKLM